MDRLLGSRLPTERAETLALTWPVSAPAPDAPTLPAGFVARSATDRGAFDAVQASIGFAVTDAHWRELAKRLVCPLVLVEREGVPLASAAATRREGGWVELGWVAVAPTHRGLGLGHAVCAQVTRAALAQGQARLFGSTQDHRLSALAIYFALGFHPVDRPEKRARWQAVCAKLGVPYAPSEWGWGAGGR